MKTITLFIIFSLIVSGCASSLNSNRFQRNPANAIIDVNEAMSFKKTVKSSKIDLTDIVKNQITNQLSNNSIESQFIAMNSLPNEAAFKVEFDIVDGKYIVRILHIPDAFMDHEAAISLFGFIHNFTYNSQLLNSPYEAFEMYYNAKEKDLESIDNLLKLRGNITAIQNIVLDKPSEEIITDISNEINAMRAGLVPEIKKIQKIRKEQKTLRKESIDLLDKATNDLQFKTLVAKNDRNGAAELIRKYLPYEDMAPFEKRFWNSYLEIIKHPLPLDERVIIYRGIDDDFIHQAIVNGQEVGKIEAIKDSEAFLMSTVLVKNQGSWNRRLRSLESMEDKFIGTVNGSDEFTRSARITTMFKNHSIDPKGSPFLSFSPDLGVAIRFGRQKNSAYLIDPRLLQFNFTSGYKGEKEFLIPLMTFPDELIGIWTAETSPDKLAFAYFDQRFSDLIANKFGTANKEKIMNQIYKNTKDFFSPVYNVEAKAPATYKSTGILEFFKKFITKKEEPSIVTDSNGNLTCESLMKVFWNKK